jgi:hypothetical protein
MLWLDPDKSKKMLFRLISPGAHKIQDYLLAICTYFNYIGTSKKPLTKPW